MVVCGVPFVDWLVVLVIVGLYCRVVVVYVLGVLGVVYNGLGLLVWLVFTLRGCFACWVMD